MALLKRTRLQEFTAFVAGLDVSDPEALAEAAKAKGAELGLSAEEIAAATRPVLLAVPQSKPQPADKPAPAAAQGKLSKRPPVPFVVTWREAVCQERALRVGVRYFLLALSLFMDQAGFCFPSQPVIAKKAGLNEKTVRRHVACAVATGWLEVRERRLAKHRTKPGRPALAYQALIPEIVA